MELLTNFSIEAAVQMALQELENDPALLVVLASIDVYIWCIKTTRSLRPYHNNIFNWKLNLPSKCEGQSFALKLCRILFSENSGFYVSSQIIVTALGKSYYMFL